VSNAGIDQTASGGPAPAWRRWLRDAERVDAAVYGAVAGTPTPALDVAMSRLSAAADYSRLSLASAAVLALSGARGRRAALCGLASVGVTATVVNVALKPLGRRRRPDRAAEQVPPDRHVPMPVSASFPSGHSAAAFAFATGVGGVMPRAAALLRLLAALVAYSRVHTGVHYPGDVVAGSLIGTALAQTTTRALEHRRLLGAGARREPSRPPGARRRASSTASRGLFSARMSG
jgi:membrane-associated phospholipid phosphatase